MKATKKISVALTEEQYGKIQQLAEESCRSRAGYLRRVITKYLRDVEQEPEQKIT